MKKNGTALPHRGADLPEGVNMRTIRFYSNPAIILAGEREMYTRSVDDYEEILRSAIKGETIDLNEFVEDLNAEPFYGKIQEIRMTVERYRSTFMPWRSAQYRIIGMMLMIHQC